MRGDADGDGRDEIFVNMQRLTLALRGDGTLLWEDKTLRLHAVGILAWYDYPISTGPLEGTNNKIKTMKRQAYGFRDPEFLRLKILGIHETTYALVG